MAVSKLKKLIKKNEIKYLMNLKKQRKLKNLKYR